VIRVRRSWPHEDRCPVRLRARPPVAERRVSVSDLELERDGKTVYGRYRKQYSGLRLLMHAGGKYFLLPSHWRRGRDRVAEIPDDGQVRIEILTHLQ
jgi:hypothetical protein